MDSLSLGKMDTPPSYFVRMTVWHSLVTPDKIRAMKMLILLAALPLLAADPDGFAEWKSADIQARAKAAKLDEHKAGADRVANWGNHGLLIVRREGDGEAEVHENQVDVITVVRRRYACGRRNSGRCPSYDSRRNSWQIH